MVPEADESLKKRTFVLFDATSHDVQQLSESASNSANICLEWEWVLACNEEKLFLGPFQNDWAGHRFHPAHNFVPPEASSSATASTRYTQSTSPNPSPLPTERDLHVIWTSPSHVPLGPGTKRQRSKSPQLVRRHPTHLDEQAKRQKTLPKEKGRSETARHIDTAEDSTARTRRAASPSLRPPTPPRKVKIS